FPLLVGFWFRGYTRAPCAWNRPRRCEFCNFPSRRVSATNPRECTPHDGADSIVMWLETKLYNSLGDAIGSDLPRATIPRHPSLKRRDETRASVHFELGALS